MLIPILVIYIFFLLHFLRRLLGELSFLQEKGYDCAKVKQELFKKADFKTFKETIISLSLLLSSLLLIKYTHLAILYIILFFGFGYFVYSALVFLTRLLNKKYESLKMNLRNILLVALPLFITLIPIIFSWYIYASFTVENGSNVSLVPSGDEEVVSFLPSKEDGVNIIPLETLSIVILFSFLFLLDLSLPIIVALLTAITSIFQAGKKPKSS